MFSIVIWVAQHVVLAAVNLYDDVTTPPTGDGGMD